MQKISFKNNYHIIQGFSFFRYVGDALIYAFLALYFQSLNLSSLETGTLLASVPVMAIVGNIIMSFLSKSIKFNLVLMKIIMPLEIAGMVLIGFFSTFVPVLLCSILMNICNSCFYSLLDGLAGDISTTAKRNYAGIRIFGSIAYLVASFSGGFLIQAISYRYTFIVGAITYGIAYIFLYIIKHKELSQENKDEKISGFIKYLSHNKTFILYLIFYILIISMSNISDSFFSMYAKQINGMPERVYGIVYSSMILAEVIVMLISMKFKFSNKKICLIISATFLLTRTLLLCFRLPYEMLYVIPAFRGLGWGLLLAYHLNTLKTFVKKEYVTKAILILTIGLQTFNAIFDQFGPLIIEHSSYNTFFLILLITGLIGFVFLIFNPLNPQIEEKQDKNDQEG